MPGACGASHAGAGSGSSFCAGPVVVAAALLAVPLTAPALDAVAVNAALVVSMSVSVSVFVFVFWSASVAVAAPDSDPGDPNSGDTAGLSLSSDSDCVGVDGGFRCGVLLLWFS